MKRVTLTATTLLVMVLVTVTATNQTTQANSDETLMQARFEALNAIFLEPYTTWKSPQGRDRHRTLADNDWMDWSEDGCSTPYDVNVPYKAGFIHYLRVGRYCQQSRRM